MTRTRNILMLIGILVCLFAAVPAQADIVRSFDSQPGLIELFTVVGTIAPGATTVSVDVIYAEGFSAEDFDFGPSALVVRGQVAMNSLGAWYLDSGQYDSYVGYWNDSVNPLTINDEVVGGSGEWFYNLQFDGSLWGFDNALVLDFGPAAYYEFTLYAVADVPEPATLALVGLGLAGLGLARRKRSK